MRNNKYKITKHSTLSHYKSVIDANRYKTLYKFATIRNPWDMMISYYFSPYRNVSYWDRNEFLRLIKAVKPLRHYISETTLTERLLGKIKPVNHRKIRPLDSNVDFIIRFEKIDEDFKTVCEKLDIPYTPLPKRNASARSNYKEYYDDELKNLVRNKFKEEIEHGNYNFKAS